MASRPRPRASHRRRRRASCPSRATCSTPSATPAPARRASSTCTPPGSASSATCAATSRTFDQHYLPEGSGLPPDGVTVLGPGEGERLELGESTATDQGSASTRSASFEAEIGARLPAARRAHRHLKSMESFYVIEGELGLILDGSESTLGAGGFAAVTPGTVHTSPPSAAPLRFLNVFTPGGHGAPTCARPCGSGGAAGSGRLRHRVRLKTPLSPSTRCCGRGGIEHYR